MAARVPSKKSSPRLKRRKIASIAAQASGDRVHSEPGVAEDGAVEPGLPDGAAAGGREQERAHHEHRGDEHELAVLARDGHWVSQPLRSLFGLVVGG